MLRKEEDGNGLTGDWLCATGIGDADKLFHEDGVLLMIPVANNDCVLLIVRMDLLFWVDYDRCTQAVNVVPLKSALARESTCRKKREYKPLHVCAPNMFPIAPTR